MSKWIEEEVCARHSPLRRRKNIKHHTSHPSLLRAQLEPGLRVSYGLKTVLASTQSKFQTVDVVDLAPFGRLPSPLGRGMGRDTCTSNGLWEGGGPIRACHFGRRDERQDVPAGPSDEARCLACTGSPTTAVCVRAAASSAGG